MYIGMIMDGNRRWAKAHDMSAGEGHYAGFEKLKEVISWCKEIGVEGLTVYAFSTENWSRAPEEVDTLMNIFRAALKELHDMEREGMRLLIIGDRTKLPADIVEQVEQLEQATAHESTFVFTIALSYGGRSEILDAIRRIPAEKLQTVSEEEFSNLLWTRSTPDPDLIIRTSGEQRLSNFLPWQGVYSELLFTDTLWPALTREEFDSMISEYRSRERRRGK